MTSTPSTAARALTIERYTKSYYIVCARLPRRPSSAHMKTQKGLLCAIKEKRAGSRSLLSGGRGHVCSSSPVFPCLARGGGGARRRRAARQCESKCEQGNAQSPRTPNPCQSRTGPTPAALARARHRNIFSQCTGFDVAAGPSASSFSREASSASCSVASSSFAVSRAGALSPRSLHLNSSPSSRAWYTE